MTIVAQVIKNKSEQAIFTISPEATVLEAITIMAEKSYSTTVAEIMTAKVITVGLNNTVEECLQLMTDRHLRHLPVLDNGKFLIEQLKQYISG
ncbi:CBS domain-containing protein [Acinetobacter baumannii]|nr:CBS domain-containing protein [Acinetobacter baumannii]